MHEATEEHQHQEDGNSTGSSASPDEWSSSSSSEGSVINNDIDDDDDSVDSRYSHDHASDRHGHHTDKETTERRRRCLIISFLSGVLTLLIVAFGLQLRELYDDPIENARQATDGSSTKQSQLIQEMLNAKIAPNVHHKPLPMEDNETFTMPPSAAATRIYTHSALSSLNYRAGGVLSDEMIDQYERDGVLVIRNLISPLLLDRLQQAGDILFEEEMEENGDRGKRRGKQFHMVKNAVIFKGVPPPFHAESEFGDFNDNCSIGYCSTNSTAYAQTNNSNYNKTKTTILSSFRDLAIYSKLPRVAASLLRLDEIRVGGMENLNVGSRKARERSRRKKLLEDGVYAEALEEDYVIDESINLRICRDIYLTKDDDPYACGWHVDDTGFWPSVAEDPGVNAWVALDDMPWPWTTSHPEDGVVANHRQTARSEEMERSEEIETSTAHGENTDDNHPVATFALALGSHRAPWRHEAYHTTGSTHTQPPEGFQSAADLIERRTGSGTCNVKTSAPHLYEKLEERKVVYDLKRGDVIFHDRWVFHRTVTMDEYSAMVGGEHAKRNKESSQKIFRRYSIRYSPGSARVPPGYGFELSALHNPDNANSTLNEIVARDGPFYPKVWPHVLKRKLDHDAVDGSHANYEEEIEGLAELVYVKIPRAEKIQKERKKEVNRLLSARGRV